jgi:hypothetical protein
MSSPDHAERPMTMGKVLLERKRESDDWTEGLEAQGEREVDVGSQDRNRDLVFGEGSVGYAREPRQRERERGGKEGRKVESYGGERKGWYNLSRNNGRQSRKDGKEAKRSE